MLDSLFLIFCSVRFLYCSFSLSLYILGTLSEEGDGGQKKKKDEEESLTEVDIEVSWWIDDLRADQLNAFRVNSKRDTLK